MTPDPIPPGLTLQDVLIRMMTPMRREFSRNLDVQHFLRDPGYAEAILAQAQTSSDERLQGYVQRIRALREASDITQRVADAGSEPAPDADNTKASAERKGARAVDAMMGKYTRGLR